MHLCPSGISTCSFLFLWGLFWLASSLVLRGTAGGWGRPGGSGHGTGLESEATGACSALGPNTKLGSHFHLLLASAEFLCPCCTAWIREGMAQITQNCPSCPLRCISSYFFAMSRCCYLFPGSLKACESIFILTVVQIGVGEGGGEFWRLLSTNLLCPSPIFSLLYLCFFMRAKFFLYFPILTLVSTRTNSPCCAVCGCF